MKLLCLTRDEAIIQEITNVSVEQGWKSLIISERSQVLSAVKEFDPDLTLVEFDNLEDLQWWQDQGIGDQRPVIFMNKELSEEIFVRAFECGADGLLPKMLLNRRSLLARVNAYLRRKALADSRRFVPRLSLVLDSQRYKVEVRGNSLALTLTEFKILRALATEQNLIVSRKELQSEAFNQDQNQISKRSLDVHICSLRKKLAPQGLDIASVRGVGYRLNPCAS
jgi:DNA-binding response OmpR family regulator